MKSELIGTKVRLVYPLRAIAVASEGERGSLVQLPNRVTLSITGVANEITGLLSADWNGKQVMVFEQDLRSALDGTAPYQLPPDEG